jgi:hypothetical protein
MWSSVSDRAQQTGCPRHFRRAAPDTKATWMVSRDQTGQHRAAGTVHGPRLAGAASEVPTAVTSRRPQGANPRPESATGRRPADCGSASGLRRGPAESSWPESAAPPCVRRVRTNKTKSNTRGYRRGHGVAPRFAGMRRNYLPPPLGSEKRDVVHHSCLRRRLTLPFSQISSEVIERSPCQEAAAGPQLALRSVNPRGDCSERRRGRAPRPRGADIRSRSQRSAGEAGALGLSAPCRRLMSRSTPASCPAIASTGSSGRSSQGCDALDGYG